MKVLGKKLAYMNVDSCEEVFEESESPSNLIYSVAATALTRIWVVE